MAKSAKKIEENFLTSNVFTFESYACKCKKDIVYSNLTGEAESAIKITEDRDRMVRFAFGSKVGLVRINNDGSIAESNLLGKLISIDKSDLSNYFNFFKENGFLIPVSGKTSDVITQSELICIINRLQATLELMSTITDMSRTSYEKIVRMIFFHLFSPVVEIETKDGGYKYVSARRSYVKFLEEHKEDKQDDRLNDTFNNAKFEFEDTVSKISIESELVDSVLKGQTDDVRFDNTILGDVFHVYCSSRDGKSKTMLHINDFVFHYLYEVGVVEHVDLERTYYLNNEIHKENFSTILKSRAVEIARYIIRDEIELNLRRVRPTYNISELEPTWKIDSLLSALYFGLFYMRPNMETYRRCANPKCSNFFLVPISSQKKKYCSKVCMNREMAARKRARDKINETRNK